MFTLRNGATSATIAPQGAEIMVWNVGGRPLLWEAKADVWPETAPLLFPVVGWTKDHAVRVGARSYPLGLHGFARQRTFRLIEQRADRVRLELASDGETRALYPFDFVLTVDYRAEEGAISNVLTVKNTGRGPMPYACGLHPGFRWPFAGGAPEDYILRFAKPENPVLPRIAPGGLIAEAKRHVPLDGNILHLDAALFDNDALCFLNAASRSVRFEAPDGSAIVVESEDFPHFGVWCRPGNGYLCIEEWSGFSDPEHFTGDLFDKPSMRVLPPGGRGRHAARFAYESGRAG